MTPHPKTYANLDVLEFYKQLPFNYYGSSELHAKVVKSENVLLHYPPIVPYLKKGLSVIDVGCGAGLLPNSFAYYYDCKVTGIDFNPVAIERAKEVASILHLKVDFRVEDLFVYRPAKKFALVTSVGVLHHTNDCLEAIRVLCRNFVSSGGHFYLGLYHAYGRRPFLEYFDQMKKREASEDEMFDCYAKLHSNLKDEVHLRSWFRDQVLHPHETQHSLEEILSLLREENMVLLSTSINKFEPVDWKSIFELEKTYERKGQEALREGRYFPGFFIIFAQKSS